MEKEELEARSLVRASSPQAETLSYPCKSQSVKKNHLEPQNAVPTNIFSPSTAPFKGMSVDQVYDVCPERGPDGGLGLQIGNYF
jgi:hypothetical protein